MSILLARLKERLGQFFPSTIEEEREVDGFREECDEFVDECSQSEVKEESLLYSMKKMIMRITRVFKMVGIGLLITAGVVAFMVGIFISIIKPMYDFMMRLYTGTLDDTSFKNITKLTVCDPVVKRFILNKINNTISNTIQRNRNDVELVKMLRVVQDRIRYVR